MRQLFLVAMALGLGACNGFSLYPEDAKGVPVEDYQNIDKPTKRKLEGRMLVSASRVDYLHLDGACEGHKRALKNAPRGSSPATFWVRGGHIVDASGRNCDGLALCSCCKR